jgi:hypothetical protein
MVPDLQKLTGSPWKVLPPGIHQVSLADTTAAFGTNPKRRKLCGGLARAARALAKAGCVTLIVDGSFVTGKPAPRDYDAIWDPTGVDKALLDPVFLDFDNKRAKQKAKYGGEHFIFGMEAEPGVSFVSFFRRERYSGKEKGILMIDLTNETF